MSFSPVPVTFRTFLRPALAGSALLTLAACSWFGNEEAPPLPGDRISILSLEQTLEADAGLADLEVRLPAPYENANWPQAGGIPAHALYHLELGDDLKEIWRVDIGDGSDDENRMFSSPVIANGKVYTMDASTTVRAYSAEDGSQLWEKDLTPEDEDEGSIGGGVSVAIAVFSSLRPTAILSRWTGRPGKNSGRRA